jgi:predicted membrane protein
MVQREEMTGQEQNATATSRQGRVFWGGLLILFGVLLLFDRMNMLDFGEVMHDYWPLILVFIGVKMILFPSKPRTQTSSSSVTEPLPGEQQWQSTTDPAMVSNYLTENRFIGDIHLRLQSDDFRGGTVSTFIGDVKIDLANVMITTPGDRFLTMSGFIGDATLYMPKDIAHSIQASALIGDFKVFGKKDEGFGLNRIYKSANYDQAEVRLNVRVSFFIGDVKIL